MDLQIHTQILMVEAWLGGPEKGFTGEDMGGVKECHSRFSYCTSFTSQNKANGTQYQ